jgi:hypothetical protein
MNIMAPYHPVLAEQPCSNQTKKMAFTKPKQSVSVLNNVR